MLASARNLKQGFGLIKLKGRSRGNTVSLGCEKTLTKRLQLCFAPCTYEAKKIFRNILDFALQLYFSPLTLSSPLTYEPKKRGGGGQKSMNRVTTLESKMNAKLSPHRFWRCHENGLIKTIQTIPHNLYVSFKLTSLYCGLG